jgi:hypothetical protein
MIALKPIIAAKKKTVVTKTTGPVRGTGLLFLIKPVAKSSILPVQSATGPIGVQPPLANATAKPKQPVKQAVQPAAGPIGVLSPATGTHPATGTVPKKKNLFEILRTPKAERTTQEQALLTMAILMNSGSKKHGLSKVTSSLQNLNKAVLQPVKNLVKNPGLLLKPKEQFKQNFREGKNIGRALENTVVAINPIYGPLEKLNIAGKKAGGVGNVLGRFGQKTLDNPIATVGIVWAAVVAAGYAAAAWASGSTTAATTGTTAAEAATAATQTVSGGLLGSGSGLLGSEVTAAEVASAVGYAGTAATAVGKINSALQGPKAAAQAADAARTQAILAQRQQQSGFFSWLFRLLFGGAK